MKRISSRVIPIVSWHVRKHSSATVCSTSYLLWHVRKWEDLKSLNIEPLPQSKAGPILTWVSRILYDVTLTQTPLRNTGTLLFHNEVAHDTTLDPSHLVLLDIRCLYDVVYLGVYSILKDLILLLGEIRFACLIIFMRHFSSFFCSKNTLRCVVGLSLSLFGI